MKKQLLMFFLLLAGTSSYAQIGVGTILAGGDLAYSRQNGESKTSAFNTKSTHSTFGANPKVGYFISPNLVIGTGISYYKYTSELKATGQNNQNSKNSMRSIGFSPFGRYYKMLGDRAGFFGQLTASFLRSTVEYSDEAQNKFNAGSLVVAPGLVFFATPRIGLETTIGQLGYFHSKFKYSDNALEGTTNGFEAGVNASNVFLGINYYFGR
jgi:hypothetical protein